MDRRSFIRNSSLAFAALSLSDQKILSALVEDPWKINMLTEDIGIFTERGGTIGFLLSKKGIVVVDSQFPDQSKHLIDELKKKSKKPFRLLINTHHHGDHTAGNISFKGIAEHVLAHENSKKNQETWAKQNKNEDKQLYPDQTYTDSWRGKFGKQNISLHYFGPGHTNGDSLIHFEESNIVHMGDLVFNRRHPFIDRAAGASINNWIVILNKTVNKFDRNTVYIFGHAGTGYEVKGNADDLNKFGEYLNNVLQFVDKELMAGKTKEEILKATEIPGSPEWKGDGISRPLTSAYEELMMKSF
jgi:cyclase